jgi:hypothetical protein
MRAGEGTGRLIFHGSVKEQAVKIFHVPRVWRFAVGESAAAKPRAGGLRPPPNARFATGL